MSKTVNVVLIKPQEKIKRSIVPGPTKFVSFVQEHDPVNPTTA